MAQQDYSQLIPGLQKLVDSLKSYIQQRGGGGQFGQVSTGQSIQSPNYQAPGMPGSSQGAREGATGEIPQIGVGKGYIERFNEFMKSQGVSLGRQPSTPAPTAEDRQAEERLQVEKYATIYGPMKAIFEQQKNVELGKHKEEAAQRMEQMKNSLAMRGSFGVASQASERLNKLAQDEERLASEISLKYDLMSATMESDIKTKALAAADKRIADLTEQRNKEIEQIQTQEKQFLDFFKTMNDAEFKELELNLKKQQLELDRQYKAGQLTIDEYNAETSRLRADSDIMKQVAEARKIKSETELLTKPPYYTLKDGRRVYLKPDGTYDF